MEAQLKDYRNSESYGNFKWQKKCVLLEETIRLGGTDISAGEK